MSKDKLRSHCPINYAQETFGDRWSLLIIRDLMFRGKKYYGDFLASEEKISTNILADRLEKLESKGLITKQQDPENLSKNIYSLTEKGLDLMPMLAEMIVWGAKYDDKTAFPQEYVKAYEKDKEGFLKMFKAKLIEQMQTASVS